MSSTIPDNQLQDQLVIYIKFMKQFPTSFAKQPTYNTQILPILTNFNLMVKNNRQYYTRQKLTEIISIADNKAREIIKKELNLVNLRKLYIGYLKNNYQSSYFNQNKNSLLSNNYKNVSDTNLSQYNNFKQQIKDENDINEAVNKANFDLAVMIQRDLNFFNNKISKEKDYSKLQVFIDKKNIVQSLFDSHISRNPSIQMQNVISSALDLDYIILENFEITEKYIAVC